MQPNYLLVDGHSVIFAWPELRALHEQRTSLAREALVRRLRDYQDWTGIHVVVVFDGTGSAVSECSEAGEVQIFYSRAGQTADSIIERLASKYAPQFRILVATSDYLEQETASACGAECITTEALRGLLDENRLSGTSRSKRLKRRPEVRGPNL
jgi:predicted RNA-binding protein with PIN domain